jgi:hypothetical protein
MASEWWDGELARGPGLTFHDSSGTQVGTPPAENVAFRLGAPNHPARDVSGSRDLQSQIVLYYHHNLSHAVDFIVALFFIDSHRSGKFNDVMVGNAHAFESESIEARQEGVIWKKKKKKKKKKKRLRAQSDSNSQSRAHHTTISQSPTHFVPLPMHARVRIFTG